MARNIAAIVTLLGEATLGIGALLARGLVIALFEWYRCAELTSDRAALLCVQDLEPARDTFMKLEARMQELKAHFELEDRDLNLNLGPLGDLL